MALFSRPLPGSSGATHGSVEDSRRDYGENRRVAFGEIAERLHVLVYTQRDTMMRIISSRKANKRKQRYYAEATN